MTAFEEAPENENIQSTLSEIEQLLQKQSFTVEELLTLYANLGYKIGQNLATQVYSRNLSEIPNLEELSKLYYVEPSVDLALMLNSLTMLSWIEDLKK